MRKRRKKSKNARWNVPVEIHVPELGESVTEATVGKWLKNEGDQVTAGEPVVELETDKVNFEVEAEQDGVLESIAVSEGADVGVGDVIGTIGEGSTDGATPQVETEKEEAEEAEAEEAEGREEKVAPEAQETEAEQAEFDEADGHREDGGGRASPTVRRLAQEYGIDLAAVSGSGRGGRVTKEDVERLIPDQERGGGQQNQAPERQPDRGLEDVPQGQRRAAGHRARPQALLRYRCCGEHRARARSSGGARRGQKELRRHRARHNGARPEGARGHLEHRGATGRHVHHNQRRHLRLPELDAYLEHTAGGHLGDAQDSGEAYGRERRDKGPAHDVPRPLLRPPYRGRRRRRAIPRPHKRAYRGPGVALAGGLETYFFRPGRAFSSEGLSRIFLLRRTLLPLFLPKA